MALQIQPPAAACRRNEAIASVWFMDDADLAATVDDLAPPESLREAGLLLGVPDLDSGRMLYPAFQCAHGALHPAMADVLSALIQTGRSGWAQLNWFRSPNGLLGGARPIHVFVNEPDRVAAAAAAEFSTPSRLH